METYCIFSPQYLPNVGGVERYTYNLAKKLLDRGNKVIVVTNSMEAEKKNKEENILVIRVSAFRLFEKRLLVTVPSAEWKEVCKILIKKNVSKVIVQTCLYTLSIMGMHFAYRNRIPCVAIIHGSYYASTQDIFFSQIEKLYEDCLLKIAQKFCQNFCAVSSASAEWMNRRGIHIKGILYNSVNEKEIQYILRNTRENWRKKYSIPKEEIIVVFVGRLIKEKGIERLIEAVNIVNKTTNISLFVAGNGPLYEKLKKKTFEKIYVLGEISFESVISLLKDSDIFCLPSDAEGFPTSVLEAVIAHSYIITAPYGGAKELIVNNDFGLVMKDNSLNEIVNSLYYAVKNPELRKNAEEKVYNRFMNNFTWDKTCDELEKIDWK